MSRQILANLTINAVLPCMASAEPFWRNADQSGDAERLLAWYASRVRPLLACSARSTALFISRSGEGITATAIGERFQRAVKDAGIRKGVSNWTAWTARHD
jgi:site-specific recombinase XerD